MNLQGTFDNSIQATLHVNARPERLGTMPLRWPGTADRRGRVRPTKMLKRGDSTRYLGRI